MSKGLLQFVAQKNGSMEIEALKVNIHNILNQVTIFWQEDRQGGCRTGGIRRRGDVVTAQGDEYPLVNIMLESCLAGITSGYEAMGTNSDIFLVKSLRSKLEILYDIRGNTKAFCKRLEHISIKNRILVTSLKDIPEDWTCHGSRGPLP